MLAIIAINLKASFFSKLVCSTDKHSHHKELQVLTDQNTAQTKQKHRALLDSVPHEKCIILSPVASLCGESHEGSGGVLLYRQQTSMNDRRIELVCIIWQLAGSQSELLYSSSRIRMNVLYTYFSWHHWHSDASTI